MAKNEKMTPADVSAAAKLRAIWDARADPKAMTQEWAGEQLEITQGAVSQYLNGHTPLGFEATVKFAALLGVKPSAIRADFGSLASGVIAPGRGGDDPYISIRMRSARAAAGHGAQNDVDPVIGGLKFLRKSLERRNLAINSLEVIFADGDSMAPRILNGDALLVDTSQKQPKHGRVFVFHVSGEECVKRLQRAADGGWQLVSDNNATGENPPIPVRADWHDVAIIGRVVWTGGWMP